MASQSSNTNPFANASAPDASKDKYNIMQEIDNIRNEIDDLLKNAPKDDPDFKKNVKKLEELKKVLGKKVEPTTSRPDVSSKKDKKKTPETQQTASNSNEHQEPAVTHHHHRHEHHHEPQPLVNMNLDETLLYGIDNLISGYEAIRRLIRK
jgi:hypothetical protein